MGGMFKAIFGGSDMPSVPKAPPSPSIHDAEVAAAADELRRKRAGHGRSSTILTDSSDKQGAKTLLGAGY